MNFGKSATLQDSDTEGFSSKRALAKTLMAAGVVGMGAAALGMAGITADLADKQVLAQFIFSACEPMVQAGAELYRAVYNTLSGATGTPELANMVQLLPNASEGEKVSLASMAFVALGAGLTTAGHKMCEILDNAKWMKDANNNDDFEEVERM